ncbi:putative cytosolic sulfotransferase 7-like isoform X1 [Capsicum annuum]|nr:putative cytosolic sulfotransferase 7-like isoform X1 [Capsicum annuum]KAF3621709.1 putative cytosolic sulfotransferase 7-like isoform X1 [Capsicum annuum]
MFTINREPFDTLIKENSRNAAKRRKEEFHLWFEEKSIIMTNMDIFNNTEITDVSTIPPPEKKRKGRGKRTGLSTLKKRKKNDNGKLKMIIPPDRTVAVGPGAKDFVTELSVKALHNARHDVKNWKTVPDLAKDKIVAYMLKFATKEKNLQNMPADVNKAEWKFLVEYFSSDKFKDKVKDVIAEKIQQIEEGIDVDPIINAAFVEIMGEKSKYILGQGFGIKPASRISRNEIHEQLQAQQKEAEEHRKRESVESKLMKVKNQFEEEQKN